MLIEFRENQQLKGYTTGGRFVILNLQAGVAYTLVKAILFKNKTEATLYFQNPNKLFPFLPVITENIHCEQFVITQENKYLEINSELDD